MLSNIDRHYLDQRATLSIYEKEVVDLAMDDMRQTCKLLRVPFNERYAVSLEASVVRFVMNSREV